MTTETKTVSVKTNGVDVEALFATIDQIKAQPSLANFRFNQTNRWLGAGINRSTIRNFYGAGTEQPHPKPFVLDADEPPVLLGTDSAANPVEYLLHALTACVTTSMVFHAAARGIRIDEIESRTEGDIDLHGFLGIDDNVHNGFQNIRMTFKIKADAPDEKLEEICRLGPTYSPVFDTLTRAVNVEVGLEK